MKTILGLTAALACAVSALSASASESRTAFAGFAMPVALPAASGAKVAGNNERGGAPQANPQRSYPPSCASGTLPDKPSGTVYEKDIVLLAAKGGRPVAENAKVVVWRIPCSSSGQDVAYNDKGAPNSMTLVRFERSAELEDQFYFIPTISVAQGTIEFGKPASYPRVASEPNTRQSDTLPGIGLYASTTYVLENATFKNAGRFNFNKAFKIRIDPRNDYIAAPQAVDIDIPAYTAPAAFSMPIDGYAAAQWINGEKGHGLLVQVTESDQNPAGAAMPRQLVYDLLLKDLEGNPFWLVGSASVPAGATSITIDAAYLGKDLEQKPWGKATFQLQHCNRLDVAFTPNADLAAPVPSFNGTIAYDRLFSANGMLCE
ncbi:hypothetical protein [Dokdonella sp.]|uniref:hypothetical protein n=1 Tax=Dokdonella sp. TaxID=2291710 RepID=UPI002638C101|nr:hypothetical protein [Dokdonella sp.]